MKKLFCVVVTDNGIIGLVSPIIFHIKCETSEQAEDAVLEMLHNEYEYDSEALEVVDIFTLEVGESDVIEL